MAVPQLSRSFRHLKNKATASFSDFLAALAERASVVGDEHDWQDEHYMLQSNGCDRLEVRLLPVEMLEAGMASLAQATGLYLNASGLTSSHYRRHGYRHDAGKNVGAANWPYPMVKDKMPSYSAFLSDGAGKRAVCCLFADDVDLYRKACQQDWLLHNCAECRRTCARELYRLEQACGTTT